MNKLAAALYFRVTADIWSDLNTRSYLGKIFTFGVWAAHHIKYDAALFLLFSYRFASPYTEFCVILERFMLLLSPRSPPILVYNIFIAVHVSTDPGSLNIYALRFPSVASVVHFYKVCFFIIYFQDHVYHYGWGI